MNLNYGLLKTINLLINSIGNYFIFKIFIICSIILFVILLINKKYQKYIITIVNIVLIVLIIYYYHSTLISKETFRFIMHNIRFYFLNSLIFLIIVSIINWFIKQRIVVNIIYCLSLMLISFALFMTHYVNNVELITVGNIYPMIVFGNYLYLILYIDLIVIFVISLVKKKDFDKK